LIIESFLSIASIVISKASHIFADSGDIVKLKWSIDAAITDFMLIAEKIINIYINFLK